MEVKSSNSDKKQEPKKLDNSRKKFLEKHLHLTRAIQTTSDSKAHGQKTSGVTTGHIRKGKKYSEIMMTKVMTKSHGKKKRFDKDRRDWFMEYITAPLYNRILPGGSPNIELITDQKNPEMIAYRSNFLKKFNEFYNSTDNKIKNFEKVMAACMFMGEVDFHQGNIGYITTNQEKIAVKIDHGRSAFKFHKNPSELLYYLQDGLDIYEYSNSLDLDLFLESVKQINSISKDEIEQLLSPRFYNLAKLEFDFRDIEYSQYFEHPMYPDLQDLSDYPPNDMKKAKTNIDKSLVAKKFFLDKFSHQLEVMKGLEERLEILKDIDGIDKKNWIHKVRHKDHPIKYAIDMKFTIKGKKPLEYAMEHKIKIDGEDPLIYFIKENIHLQGLNPAKYASKNKIKIDGKDPMKCVVDKNVKIDGKDPIIFALDNKLKIDGKNVFRFLNKNPKYLNQLIDNYKKNKISLDQVKKDLKLKTNTSYNIFKKILNIISGGILYQEAILKHTLEKTIKNLNSNNKPTQKDQVASQIKTKTNITPSITPGVKHNRPHAHKK